MEKLKKLLMKKQGEGKVLGKSAAKAKSSVLEDLMGDMFDQDGDKVKGLKKVTVASNSPKGLEKGLDKAKEMIGDKGMMGEEGISDEDMPEGEESAEHEADESPEMEASEHEGDEEEMSLEEIEAKIAELKDLLKEKKMKA